MVIKKIQKCVQKQNQFRSWQNAFIRRLPLLFNEGLVFKTSTLIERQLLVDVIGQIKLLFRVYVIRVIITKMVNMTMFNVSHYFISTSQLYSLAVNIIYTVSIKFSCKRNAINFMCGKNIKKVSASKVQKAKVILHNRNLKMRKKVHLAISELLVYNKLRNSSARYGYCRYLLIRSTQIFCPYFVTALSLPQPLQQVALVCRIAQDKAVHYKNLLYKNVVKLQCSKHIFF